MAKKLEVVVKEAIDFNRIANAIRKEGYCLSVGRKAKKSAPFQGSMADLRISLGRFEKCKDGWFKDNFLSAYYGKDFFWAPLSLEKNIDWHEGEKYAAEYGRQPSVFELESLKDRTKYNPCILDNAKVLDIKTDDWYWSNETVSWSSADAWCVSFGSGYVDSDDKDGTSCVRPVRSQ